MVTTWNPDDKSASITLSNGDLTATMGATTTWKSVRSTVGVSTGKWYWEITIDQTNGLRQVMAGVAKGSASVEDFAGADANGYAYYGFDGVKYNNGVPTAYGDTYTTGDIVSIALDLISGKIWFAKNGTWQDSGDPAAGTGEAYSGLVGTFYDMLSQYTTSNITTANFGDSAFTYTVPTGFNSGLSGWIGEFSGTVYEQGNPVSRTLYLYRRDSGGYVDTTTSSGNGYYYMETTYSGAHFIVCLDDEAGDDFNDLISGNVIPTTVSG